MDTATDIKEYVLGEGADLVGIAPVVRFDGAPRGHHPQDLLPTAKSVVSFGIRVGCTFYGTCLRVCPVRINLEDYAGKS